MQTRREFLQRSSRYAGGLALAGTLPVWLQAEPAHVFFKLSLAEWSLHKSLHSGAMSNLDFPAKARKDFGIEAVEYVNAFFKDKAQDSAYLAELNQRCRDNGVRSLLIMVDGEGDLGELKKKKRLKAVDNHKKWVDAAHTLGCHSIRVNAFGTGSAEDVAAAAAQSLSALGEYAQSAGINVLVENHGGYSSNGKWLAGIMSSVGQPNVGTLPDFGNFCLRRESGQQWEGKCVEEYDRYEGVRELMPFAKGVSAKSFDFDANGNEIHTDYRKMMRIVYEAGYTGYVGIEYEGSQLSEDEGIRMTRNLLLRAGSLH